MTPETIARLAARLRRHEEPRALPYLDSRGNLTVGVGHLVALHGSIPLTDAAMDAILAGDIAAKVRECERHIRNWDTLDDVRQAALVEAAFNGSLFASPKAILAVERREFAVAEAELLDGPWLDQVGDRARVVARQLRTGEWA